MLLLSVKSHCLLFLCISITENKKTKVGSEFSNFLYIPFWYSTGIEFHLLSLYQIYFLFNNYIDFASYADDTTPNVCGHNFLKL